MKKLITKITFSVLMLLGAPLITGASPQIVTPIADLSKGNFKNQNGFLFDCTGDSGFKMLFRINPTNQTVLFIRSTTSDNMQKWEMNRFHDISLWKNGRIVSYRYWHESDKSISLQTIFLDENILLNTGHYPSGEFHNQLFNCIRK